MLRWQLSISVAMTSTANGTTKFCPDLERLFLNVALLKIPVLDRTGLTGNYDFRFDYAADPNQLDAAPSIMTAIQQIGLKLNAGKGPVEMLVVDQAEKPSGN